MTICPCCNKEHYEVCFVGLNEDINLLFCSRQCLINYYSDENGVVRI